MQTNSLNMKLFTSIQANAKSSFESNTQIVSRFSKNTQTQTIFSKFLLLFGFIFSFFIGGLNAQTSYSSAGTFTWTCPAGVTSIQVEAWGGGGGGAGGVALAHRRRTPVVFDPDQTDGRSRSDGSSDYG